MLVGKAVAVLEARNVKKPLGLISQGPFGKLASMDRMQFNNPEPRRDQVVIDIWKELGVPGPKYDEDQSLAPPVDREALLAHLNREDSDEEARRVCELMVRFRSWAEAMAEIATERFKQEYPKGPWFLGENG
jgi:hypothetical protein